VACKSSEEPSRASEPQSDTRAGCCLSNLCTLVSTRKVCRELGGEVREACYDLVGSRCPANTTTDNASVAIWDAAASAPGATRGSALLCMTEGSEDVSRGCAQSAARSDRCYFTTRR
jgi:hypothetical protein